MDFKEIATTEQILNDADIDVSLRPTSLDDFVGQDQLKFRLRTFLEAAKIKGTTLGHVLFSGPPGLGKTSLSQLIATEMGVEEHATTGPALKRPEDLAAILLKLEDGDVLFIDEIHRISNKVEESLYTAMEDFYVDVVVGSGATAQVLRIPIPQFTLIGATTHTGQIGKPMLDRFVLKARLELYDKQSLKRIAVRAAYSLGLSIEDKAAAGIARRGRGTPRIVNNLLRRIGDYAEMLEGSTHISDELAEVAFEFEGIDSQGLEDIERRYLHTLISRFNTGPVGVVNLSAVLGEEEDTLKEVESFLIREGYVIKLDRGRKATLKALKHLGYEVHDFGNGGA